ncbi:MAG: hypothetical protein MI746_08290 [Pseudomonadales bacterium]|nr:hypothetical protein [Pseudomonadales bacterium]
MAYDRSKQRVRNLYRLLLRVYPKQYRERFAEQMEQTFDDLLREREDSHEETYGLIFWIFLETFVGGMRENMTILKLEQKVIVRIALTTVLVLMIPAIAMQFSDEVDWNLADFVVGGSLIFGAGLTYSWLVGKTTGRARRAKIGGAVAAGLLLVWVQLAVGIF